jgi:serine/threonine protein kinase
MAAPASVSDLLELIRKSELLDEERLQTLIDRVRSAAEVPTQPVDLATLLVRDRVLTRFQADLLLQGKARGFYVGEYRVLEPLGSGAMASVYLCEHARTGQKFAIKVLQKERAEDSEIRKRFEREGRAVSALDHPNIVRSFHQGLDGKRYFLIMEYVEGPNLVDYLKKHGVPEFFQGCDFIRQAAVGLQHIHEMGLVHRDIKPANLLVDQTGTLKIVDMGLAKFFRVEGETLTHRVVGTADFIAPEQTYDSHTVDIRADIYGLGATAYFVFTGEIPFGPGTVSQKILCHRSKQPTPLRALRPELPDGLAAVVDKMMAKDVNRRYQTPAEVVAALEPWSLR